MSNHDQVLKNLPDTVTALQSDAYRDVRRRVFRQLVESLIYEGVLPAESVQEAGEPCFLIAGRTREGEPVTYRAYGARKHTFHRIRLDRSKSLLREAGAERAEAESIAQFLMEMRDALGAEDARLVHFIHELEQTLCKDALAQHYRREAGLSLRGAAYDDLEGDVMDGHPYHPSYKSRIGFDLNDNYRYGPEFKPLLEPIWAAVEKKSARMAISADLQYQAFLEQELGADRLRTFADTVRAAGRNPDDYLYLPVHPWQWEKQVVTAFADDLRTGRIIRVGKAEDAYRPQQSIRTLANHTTKDRAYLKLSMSLINTSTGRILAPHTVQNAPLVTDWLKGLAREDAYLRDELRTVLLGEVLGVAYDPAPVSDLLQAKTYGILSCIWRESLHPHLAEGEAAVPFNALTSLDLDGRPLIEPWVREYGAEAWLKQLLTVSVLPLVHFLYAHGIALETHAQNAVLLHENGRPTRIALKDFHDGIRFSKQLLGDPDKIPQLLGTPEAHRRVNANSFIETEDAKLVCDFMHDAFFFINIGELALLMHEQYDLPEERFWSLVREVLEEYRQRFPQLSERFELFDLFAPTIQVEQLTKRRLYPDTKLHLHDVPNPLALPTPVGGGVS